MKIANYLFRIYIQLSLRRRVQLFSLLIVTALSVFSEFVTISALVPLLGALSRSQQINLNNENHIFNKLLHVQFNSTDSIIFLFLLSIIICTILRLLNIWLNCRVSCLIGHDLSSICYQKALKRPYINYLLENSSSIINTTTSQVNLTIEWLFQSLQLLTGLFLSTFIVLALLLSMGFKLTFTVFFLFAFSYTLIAIFSNARLEKNSKVITKNTKSQIKIIQEGLGMIRDIILNQKLYPRYLKKYNDVDMAYRYVIAENRLLQFIPRYFLEAIGLILFVSIALYSSENNEFSYSPIQVLGTLALGVQRLLPALQQIFGGWTSMKGINTSVADVLRLVESKSIAHDQSFSNNVLAINDTLKLSNISFKYPNTNSNVISNLSLVIEKSECIGIIGSTGSGKSTLLDIIMGLLIPQDGKIYVDNKLINPCQEPKVLTSWQSNIVHVPQNIFLSEDSLLNNIILDETNSEIDYERLQASIKGACLSSFINQLPKGLETIVGERGLRLSGGQRQRIAIARALYSKAQLLILDEATSALDEDTEEQIMSSINEISTDLTIIIVAHRVSTLRGCNRIICLKNGLVSVQAHPDKILPNIKSYL